MGWWLDFYLPINKKSGEIDPYAERNRKHSERHDFPTPCSQSDFLVGGQSQSVHEVLKTFYCLQEKSL